MSKIDEKYIDALNSFTESLEQIVETLKSQQKSNKIDTVNEMLRSTQSEKLQNVVNQLTAATKQGFSDIKAQNETILKRIETIKQQKESGMFDNISSPNNKKKIIDGVAVVGLIAVGVLAMGMAFKIIGKVDFMSVIALSTAMVFTSIAFAKVSEKVKDMKYSDIFKTASVLPIMALGLIAAGWILKGFPTFGLMQGISLVLVGGAIGIASFLLLKSIKDIDFKKNLGSILALPIILPAIALGLVTSGWILKGFPTIGLMQGISMIIVSATIGIASFLILKSLAKIDISKNWATIMALPLILPAVSLGLLLSGYILSGFTPLKDPMGLVLFSLAIGLSILFIAPSVYLLGKMSFKQIESGIIGIIAVSAAIVAISLIMSALSTTLKYPGFLWSLGVGLSLIVFGLAAVVVGFLASSSLTSQFFYPGLLAMIALSATILAVDKILNFGTYNKSPNFDWVKGVGVSLLAFGAAAVVLGIIAMSGIGALGIAAGLLAIISIAATMLAVDAILNAGSFTKYPSEGWAAGIAKSMALFTGMDSSGNKGVLGTLGGAVKGFIKGIGGAAISATMIPIAMAMLEVDKIFSQGNFTKYPSIEYSKSVSQLMTIISNINMKSSPSKEYSDNVRYYILGIVDIVDKFNKINVKNLDNFSNTINKIVPALQQLSALQPIKSDTSGYSEILNNLKNLPDMSIIDSKAVSIGKLANSLMSLANSLNLVNNNLQGFNNLSKGLFLISIIDDNKFNNVLESIDKYKNTLQVINQVPEDQTNILSVIKGLYETLPNTSVFEAKGSSISTIDEVSDRDKKLSEDISAIRELLTQVKNSIEITSITTGASFRDKVK